MSTDRTAADAHLAEVEAEQAALRRIAALLARAVPAEDVFDAVVDEVRSLMGVDAAALVRYEPDETATLLAVSADEGVPGVLPGDKLSTEGHHVMGLVLRTGRPAVEHGVEGRRMQRATVNDLRALLTSREAAPRWGLGWCVVELVVVIEG
jgi:GAF domain-containing protein